MVAGPAVRKKLSLCPADALPTYFVLIVSLVGYPMTKNRRRGKNESAIYQFGESTILRTGTA